MRLCIGYPALEEERKVLDRPHSLHPAETLEAVLSAHEVLALQARVDDVHMEENLTDYLLAIVQATRQSELLSLGVVRGRDYCLPDDIKELAPIVLSHRVMLNRTHGMRTQSFDQAERMVLDIVETVPVPV
jgi:MoxR-like ATPase